ncbi:MAG TPA: TIGR03118 family protein, partial [Caballeronia sp.]|nr:TIGR03118 family protein [Caballeronia sp.]
MLPTSAVKAYDDGAGGAVYKGVAIGKNGTANLLYATDFHNGKVDVFDKSFIKVQLDGPFKDPTLPAGFAPFGINVTGSTVFVTYAKVGQDGRTQVNGPGNGVIDTFDTGGHF